MNPQFIHDRHLKDPTPMRLFRAKLPKLQMSIKTFPIQTDSLTAKSKSSIRKPFQSIQHLSDTVTDKCLTDYFEMMEKIGEGAHSVVYKCRQRLSKKIYAVKKLKRNDPELVEAMRQCYNIMKALDHKYIVKPRFLFIQNKTSGCQIITDYYDFQDLRHFMDKTFHMYKTFQEPLTAEIIHKILMTVSYMHEKRVCHRDLKPDNILYNTFSAEIKVIDFEISRMQRYTHQKLDLWSDTGYIKYRAPQSFSGGYSYGIDVWAVGVIVYQMLTGKMPFTSPYVQDIRDKIKNQELEFENLGISKLAQKFLSKLLCKNPDERISAEEALSDPFLLKHLKANIQTCTSPMNSSFDQGKYEQRYDDQKQGFYDDETMKNFLGGLDKDNDIFVNPE